MGKKYLSLIFPAVLLFGLIFGIVMPSAARADIDEIIGDQLEELAKVGLPGEPEAPTDPVVRLIRMVLGFLALVFLILIIYAGFRWMTAAGNEENIGKAKKIIASALVGIIIIFLSYAITAFVFNVVLSAK